MKDNFVPNPIIDQNLQTVFQLVCDYYQVLIKEARLKCRRGPLKHCRQVAHYVAKKAFAKVPFSRIGAVIGNRDHATVMNSIRSIENSIKTLPNGACPDIGLRRDIGILQLRVSKLFQDVEPANAS